MYNQEFKNSDLHSCGFADRAYLCCLAADNANVCILIVTIYAQFFLVYPTLSLAFVVPCCLHSYFVIESAQLLMHIFPLTFLVALWELDREFLLSR